MKNHRKNPLLLKIDFKRENKLVNIVPFEFLISREARDKYQFAESLFSLRGDVIFGNIHAVRVFAQAMNRRRNLIQFPELAVRASEINGMGLTHEIVHYLINLYKNEHNPNLSQDLLNWLSERIDPDILNDAFRSFVDEFPNSRVYAKELDIEEYLEGETDGISNKEIVAEELLNLWLSNINSAYSNYLELFNDAALEKKKYLEIVEQISQFFETQPFFGPDNQNVVEMLQNPTKNAPHSIKGQLEYIRENWSDLIGDYLFKLLMALDIFREEEKLRGLGAGDALVYEYGDLEGENYSRDLDWMPKVVMMAKSTYVWLDQLSKKYKRHIYRLDQIPDEELDMLARWGFTALWLIGVWERSSASKKIKRWSGNPEAEASAYSLYEYTLSHDLGGYEAYQNLRERAWRRGIRLASDMVPNHMGIYSRWIVEHPDWFVSLPYAPFPSYSYNSGNLSDNPGVGIYLEEHYYSRTDAAVTFKRVDFGTGDVRYIYHGNDGTSMPWNDTAQLNFLNPELREAVIQTILHVARMFPIIRFDAAMTLTRKHYQRLWFPEPGSGGDIPSRSEHGINRKDFYQAMPKEFWREVVDRVKKEAPNTLLLAEAFWLLEGFFVRTLGMHRVYNSAFMNMLRDEDNAKYRSVIKNTIEFDPEILKRFVNFMNNPDEETAVNQFGKGDKYFGICVLMATMPGLPMFGHGQIEGFAEKYGMEYRRAYWNEEVDWGLFQHHERVIFPLLRKRYIFAGVMNFFLYDFYTPEGIVNEDVFVFSNRSGNEKALVVYHNKFADTSGWIRTSAGFAIKTDSGDKQIIQKTLGEGLNLGDSDYCIFKEHVSGLQFIRRTRELKENGLFVSLHAYEYVVFMDFQEVQDNEFFHYAHLHDFLGGRGVPNIEEVLKEIVFQPLHQAFKEIVNEKTLKSLGKTIQKRQAPSDSVITEIQNKLIDLLKELKKYSSSSKDEDLVLQEIMKKLLASFKFEQFEKELKSSSDTRKDELAKYWEDNQPNSLYEWGITLSWVFLHLLGKIATDMDFELLSRSWIDEWLLGRIVEYTLQELPVNNKKDPTEAITLIKILTVHQNWSNMDKKDEILSKSQKVIQITNNLLSDPEVQQFIRLNRYQEKLWFTKEAFETLVRWMFIIELVNCLTKFESTKYDLEAIFERYEITQTWLKASIKAGYQVERLLEILKED